MLSLVPFQQVDFVVSPFTAISTDAQEPFGQAYGSTISSGPGDLKTGEPLLLSVQFCVHKNIIVISFYTSVTKRRIREIAASGHNYNGTGFSCKGRG